MKQGFRQSMSGLHTWAGLLLGWVLFFMFLTGTAGYFDTEIDRWMKPELPAAQQVPAAQVLAIAEQRLWAQAPQAERWSVNLPVDRNSPWLRVSWRGNGPNGSEQLNQATGQPLEARASGGGQLLYRMHWRLHYLPSAMSDWLVGLATLFMLLAIVTGIIVHKKFFADFFTFRPAKGQRSWLDAHNVLSVVALPFHLMITYSGLLFFASTLMPLVIAAHYGTGEENRRLYSNELNGHTALLAEPAGVAAPLTPLVSLLSQAEARWGEASVQSLDIRHSGDAQARVMIRQHRAGPLRSAETLVFDGVSGELLETLPAIRSAPKAVNDVFLGLHEGLFAGPVLRWLYFLSGLLGTAMIATGLVLWTVKRRQRAQKQAGADHRGLVLVERLNVGTVVGLPIAIAAYFWANRLIPVAFEARAAWEAHTMFIAWGLLLLHATLRPTARAWIEQGWLAAAAFALLPVLNALTTDRHLGASLSQGDWVMAGFDLTMLAFGLAFAALAWRLTRRAQPQLRSQGAGSPLPVPAPATIRHARAGE